VIEYSSRQLISKISDWVNHLSELGRNGQSIIVEITENSLLDTRELAVEQLLNSQYVSVQVVIDVFGTGYSSLSYLIKYQ